LDTSAGSFASRTLKAAKKMTSPAASEDAHADPDDRDRPEEDRALVARDAPDGHEGEHEEESRAHRAEVHVRVGRGRQAGAHQRLRHHDEERHEDRVQPEDAGIEPEELAIAEHFHEGHAPRAVRRRGRRRHDPDDDRDRPGG
jgi:hypothetical protein